MGHATPRENQVHSLNKQNQLSMKCKGGFIVIFKSLTVRNAPTKGVPQQARAPVDSVFAAHVSLIKNKTSTRFGGET